MTTSYVLTAGPSKYDLMLGLSEKKILAFRAIDTKGKTDLFEVMIRKLGLSSNGRESLVWEFDGLIFSKNRIHSNGKHETCRATFDTQRRRGHFHVEDLEPRIYSYEYFDRLSDIEIREGIARLRESLPDNMRELKKYVATLSPHEQLVLEGLHTWGLGNACMGPMIEHQLLTEAQKIEAGRRQTPRLA